MGDPDIRDIMVTNDDGIDSVGLLVLARALAPLGRVTIVAPDGEYSGAGAAIGPLHLQDSLITEREIDGVDGAWTVDGPPALCVFYARLGAFGFRPDIVVSGINPGANLGRAVYHSGTIGATLTARNGDIPGVAVSQSFAPPRDDSDEARADYDERVSRQLWEPAAEIGVTVVAGLLDAVDRGTLDDIGVVNLNVPNLPIDQIKGWRWTDIGRSPPWAMTEARLIPRTDRRSGTYRVETGWGEELHQPPGTDAAAILDDHISVTMLSRIEALGADVPPIADRLDTLLERA
jgi:5'-nucleotidase